MPSPASLLKNVSFNITKQEGDNDTYCLHSEGLTKLCGHPEVEMTVKEGIWLAEATNIVHDVATYISRRRDCPVSGFQLCLVPDWTTVALEHETRDGKPVLVVKNAPNTVKVLPPY